MAISPVIQLTNGNLDIGGSLGAGFVVIDFSAITGTIDITPQSRVNGTAGTTSGELGYDIWYLNGDTYAKVAKGAISGVSASRIIVPCGGTSVSLLFENFAGSDAVTIAWQIVEGALPTFTA